MSYLSKSDLINSIENTLLTALDFTATDEDDETPEEAPPEGDPPEGEGDPPEEETPDTDTGGAMIITACSQAEAQLRSYLTGRYDIDTELALTSDRNELLLMLAKDLAIYHIWTYVDPSSIPAARRERYNAAIKFLEAAQLGDVSVNIDPAEVAFGTIAGGSNPKRDNHY